ncbi:MAG TPA: hypothetical protein VIS94_05440 [Desulfomonilia bacterium]
MDFIEKNLQKSFKCNFHKFNQIKARQKFLSKKIHKKIWIIKIVAYICTRFWSEELIEGLKEIGFRLQEEGNEDGEKAGKIISIFLAGRRGIINFVVPK